MRPSLILALALALLAGVAPHARAMPVDVFTIDPPTPSVGDSVKVTAIGSFTASCWDVLSTSCSPLVGDSLYIIVNVQYCGGAPICPCTFSGGGYSVTCNFGLLPAGSYVVALFENHVNPADPESSFVKAKPFTVTGPTSIARRTWARVKSFYR